MRMPGLINDKDILCAHKMLINLLIVYYIHSYDTT